MLSKERDIKEVEKFLKTLKHDGRGLDEFTGEAIETLKPYGGLGAIASHICLEIERVKLIHIQFDMECCSDNTTKTFLRSRVLILLDQAEYIRKVMTYTFKEFTKGFASVSAITNPEVLAISRGVDFLYASYPVVSFLEIVGRMERGEVENCNSEFIALYNCNLGIIFDIERELEKYPEVAGTEEVASFESKARTEEEWKEYYDKKAASVSKALRGDGSVIEG